MSNFDDLTQLHSSSDKRQYEIIFSVYNEEVNIERMILAHIYNFKLVFLDGGSTDRTRDIIISHDCDLYERPQYLQRHSHGDHLADLIFRAQHGTSYYLSHYINNYSRAKRCIFMWADEVILPRDQEKILSIFSTDKTDFITNRIDWFYGTCIGLSAKYQGSFAPGFMECCKWDSQLLHSMLIPTNPLPGLPNVNIQHFTELSFRSSIPKLGKYTEAEVYRLCGPTGNYIPLIRRYVLQVLVPIRHYRRYPTIKHFLVAILYYSFDSILGHLVYFEMYHLPDTSLQRQNYALYLRQQHT